MNSRFIVILLVLLGIGFYAQAQTSKFVPRKIRDVRGSVGISDAAMVDASMMTMAGFTNDPRATLTEKSVKPYMMPPRNATKSQDGVAYSLASCLEFYVNYKENYKQNLSPDYISLSLQAIGQNNATMDALRFLIEYGTVNAAIVNYGSTSISSSVYATQKYSILNYLHIFRADTRGRQKIFEVRKAILRGNPVLVEMKVNSNFNNLNGVDLWEYDGSALNTTQVLLVVSYNEELEALELQNTKGSTWGNSGYIWMKYNDFEQLAQNGYVLLPDVEK
jgi:hypothetical protein